MTKPNAQSVLPRMPRFEQFDAVSHLGQAMSDQPLTRCAAQDESAERHDMFRDALQRSKDKFGTISEFFGRGVMSIPTVDRA